MAEPAAPGSPRSTGWRAVARRQDRSRRTLACHAVNRLMRSAYSSGSNQLSGWHRADHVRHRAWRRSLGGRQAGSRYCVIVFPATRPHWVSTLPRVSLIWTSSFRSAGSYPKAHSDRLSTIRPTSPRTSHAFGRPVVYRPRFLAGSRFPDSLTRNFSNRPARHETHLPSLETRRAAPTLSSSHENTVAAPSCRAPRQGPQAPGRLSRGRRHPLRSIGRRPRPHARSPLAPAKPRPCAPQSARLKNAAFALAFAAPAVAERSFVLHHGAAAPASSFGGLPAEQPPSKLSRVRPKSAPAVDLGATGRCGLPRGPSATRALVTRSLPSARCCARPSQPSHLPPGMGLRCALLLIRAAMQRGVGALVRPRGWNSTVFARCCTMSTR